MMLLHKIKEAMFACLWGKYSSNHQILTTMYATWSSFFLSVWMIIYNKLLQDADKKKKNKTFYHHFSANRMWNKKTVFSILVLTVSLCN